MSRFVVRNAFERQVADAFRARPHAVDLAPGFLRMEVLQGHDNHREFLLLTYWSDPLAFRAWHRGHTFRDAHSAIPKGLKLIPETVQLTGFHKLCD